MNSMSMRPPGISFRSQMSRGGFSSSISPRISATSAAIFLGSRRRASTSSKTASASRPSERSPATTRARESAMCSQVQASSLWYFRKARMLVATGPLLPDGRSLQVDLVEHALGGRGRERGDQALGQTGVVAHRIDRLGAVGIAVAGLVVVEQDDVDVGAGRQFAAAELAHADDGDAAAGDPAVDAFDLGNDGVERGADDQVRQIGQRLAGPDAADRAGQQADADQELLLGRDDAQRGRGFPRRRNRRQGSPTDARPDSRGSAVRRAASGRACRRRHAACAR